ncbi:peptidoglycan editing factor PgeF [Bacillus aerolatus]|uniref:Purine nucleoside phosphorylase n=1 Tax=Bacillus aerolatus TaxID=2653354 RepID=A0A6I1FHR6_9BACI|nr:peptidoglycan editing factor PgeF [Bacillus aerolatus]KAB7707981.1 peptidoglycan editing factor PgeF [Bacillus aerolatus]
MTEPFVSAHNSFYIIKDWHEAVPGLVAGFSTKVGGKSTGDFNSLNTGFHVNDRPEEVRANRQTIGELLGFPAETWIGACQTHGNRIEGVTKLDSGKGALHYNTSFSDTDGLYTNEKGILLTLCYADCVPLYFLSRKHERVGTAHAGWKGTVLGIGFHMVEQWKKDGITPEEIEAVIGPSICKKCYKVDNRVIDAARRWVNDSPLPFSPVIGDPGQFHLSLQHLNELILIKAGIPKQSIRSTKRCTSCSTEFFSHRRDQGKTGRMVGFIGWKERVSS